MPPRPRIAQQAPQPPPRPAGEVVEQVIGVDRSPDALGLDKRMQGGGGAGDEPEPEPEPEELTGILPPPRPAPPPGAPSRPKNDSPGDGPPVPRPPQRPFTKTGRGEEGSAGVTSDMSVTSIGDVSPLPGSREEQIIPPISSSGTATPRSVWKHDNHGPKTIASG